MWFKVVHQMAASWRVAEAMHWQTGKQELVHQTAYSSSQTRDPSRDKSTNIVPQADRLPELRRLQFLVLVPPRVTDLRSLNNK